MRRLLLLTATLLWVVPVHALAQVTAIAAILPAQACVNQIHDRLWQQERIYREIILGRHAASQLPQGSALYDTDGKAWTKVGGTWVSGTGEGTQQMSDDQMDSAREWEGNNDPTADAATKLRRGYFETRGVKTPTLLPFLTESYRALGCRTAMVCQAVRKSAAIPAEDAGKPFTITTPGCAPLTIKPLSSCSFANTKTDAQQNDPQLLEAFSDTTVRLECQPLANAIAEYEGNLLKRAVAYDASYRELMQFAGTLDKTAAPLETSVIPLLERAVDIAMHPEKLICFLLKCNGK